METLECSHPMESLQNPDIRQMENTRTTFPTVYNTPLIVCYCYSVGEARACEERARNAMMDAARLAGGQNNSQICAKK
jgi:hypothetical protein